MLYEEQLASLISALKELERNCEIPAPIQKSHKPVDLYQKFMDFHYIRHHEIKSYKCKFCSVVYSDVAIHNANNDIRIRHAIDNHKDKWKF